MLRSSKFYKLIQSNYLKTKNTFHLQSEIKEVKTKKNETEVVTDKGNFQSKRVFNSLYNPEALLNQKNILSSDNTLLDGLLRLINLFSILVRFFSWILIYHKKRKLGFYTFSP